MYDTEIQQRTDKFHHDVIESVIEALESRFSDNHLCEELLDRLKADWKKTLEDMQNKNLEEANRKQSDQNLRQSRVFQEQIDAMNSGQYYTNFGPYSEYQSPYVGRFGAPNNL